MIRDLLLGVAVPAAIMLGVPAGLVGGILFLARLMGLL